jgi:hypothetical protein
MITVLSTGFRAPTKIRCLTSVEVQTAQHEHDYIEASDQRPPLTVTENIWRACRDLPPDRVVAWIDGDDWLAHDEVLAHVLKLHVDGALCTYGSFRFADGRTPGFKAYKDPKRCREEPWWGTHLKTFRAGLVANIDYRDLHDANGKWIDMCCDQALMFPVLEQAGAAAVFVPEILYVYSYGTSWEHRMSPEERKREKDTSAYLRGKRRYV